MRRRRDHEIARVRKDGILYWNLAAIRIIGFSVKAMYCVLDCISKIFWKFTSSTGNEEMRFHYQRGNDQRYNEILAGVYYHE